MRIFKCKGEKLLKKELRGDFKFFMQEANISKNSKGYGLIRDKTKLAPETASIASVGYGLAALVIGVERKWIRFENAYDRANRKYCINNSDTYRTFGDNSWGLTACVSPTGYSGEFGARPALSKLEGNDGTISPSGAAGSIVFTPKLSIKALEHYYNKFPKFWDRYGFKDAYNLEGVNPWYSKECIGIDKGISMLMIENYLTGLIWKYFMKNKYVIKGLEILDITKKDKEAEKV